MQLQRLFPEPGEIDVLDAVDGLAGREVLALNMVASADGRATLEGHTALLSNPADRELFHALRARGDAILVGVGTLREERYGLLAKNEHWQDERERAGLARQPLGVTVSRGLDLPYEIPLFQHPDAHVVVFTSSDREPERCPARVDVVRLDELAPAAMLRHLRDEHGIRSVVCEGGPTLNGLLFSAGVVDELFLTIAPALVGAADPLTIVAGELPGPELLTLRQALLNEDNLMLRYSVRRRG